MKRTSNKRRALSRLRGFSRHEDGATAIEFAILAIPFFMLLFGIIEVAIIFFIGSNVKNATFEASRRIRTGEFNAANQSSLANAAILEAQFEDDICQGMIPGGSTAKINTCKNRLSVEVKVLSNFSSATAFAPPPVIDPLDPPLPNFTLSFGGATVLVKSTYKFPLAIPSEISRLSNVDGENARNIKSITAFRSEPY